MVTERHFLGLEKGADGIRRAVLRLVGEDGQMLISEKGILDKDQVSLSNNLDSTHPLFIPFRIDELVNYIESAKLTIYIDKYRAYERSAKSGGGQTKTSGSSSKTSSGGGGGTTTASSDYFVKADGSTEYPLQEIYSSNFASMEEQKVDSNGRFKDHIWLGNNALVKHRHKVQLNSHTHNIEHTHNVTIDPHAHDLEYGIYEDTYPKNMKVYINNDLVAEGINSDIELDVTNYLIPNYTNIVKITSETNGFVIANLWVSHFSNWTAKGKRLQEINMINEVNKIKGIALDKELLEEAKRLRG